MAVTPQSYTLTAKTQADVTAMRNSVFQATGNYPPSSFTVGSTITVYQQVANGPFIQGPTVTPIKANTAPSNAAGSKSSSVSVGSILTASLLVEAGIAVYNSTTSNSTNNNPTILTNQTTTSTAGTTAVQNASPSPVIATDNPNPIPASTAAFDDANISPQTEVDPNSDPNLNVNEGAVDGTAEAIQNQRDLEDGSLEFAGIDTQIANNENSLQEPPQLSDEEVNNYFDQLQQEQIENSQPSTIEENVFNPGSTINAGEESVFDPTGNQGAPRGISTALNNTRATATKDDTANFNQKPDWRARLSLAPNANYLYKVPKGSAGILAPLQATDGVIFPYTPAISVTYSAGYDASELVHSNYKVYQYKGSSVDTVSITADFTAQDTTEANYLLAVIHFFRSVTKMFYGQDQNPNNGVPPPLCYLSGFGAYTFDAHPLVVTNFTYTTPTEVDYIRAGSQTNQPGVNISLQNNILNSFVPSVVRTALNGLAPRVPNFSTQNSMINSEATYVPTKLQLQITCIPIVTRNDISNKFSLKEYATGALLRGSKRSGGGIW